MDNIKKYYYDKTERLKEYIYDPTISIKDRSFIVFSITVLFGLFAAVPCGIIMHEPPFATISTLIGAVFFTAYVIISFKRNTIDRARIVISIILVFIFLPAMFFTNGGVGGGAPVWLLLGTIYIAMILDGKLKSVMLVVNMICMTVYWIIGYKYPGLVTEYSISGNYIDTMAAIIIVSLIIFSLLTFQISLLRKEEEDKNLRKLFAQTATALVNAIDAKDKYTQGHSSRVAEYSRKIAEQAGKSERECDDIYYIALLHDVGKIGIPERIINKEGKLTDEEYEIMKQHPNLGSSILETIDEIPYISIGAHYHHERYDGKGYPAHLKGTDIPEYARIISVADAYDAMTSTRSYRETIPQQQVREELVKGAGTQFDPEFARIMLHLLDIDSEYEMKERSEITDGTGKDEVTIGRYRSDFSEGILLDPFVTTINLKVKPDKDIPGREPKPCIILFDALDGRIHDDERNIKELLYFEYGEIDFDGNTKVVEARKMQVDIKETQPDEDPGENVYRIIALRIKDHALIRIIGHEQTAKIIVALTDNARYAYIGLSGEHCHIYNIRTEKSEKECPADYIPRIAEEISYINVPAGDIPNIQVDGYRTCATAGIPIRNGMKITFHTRSLPTARLVWHCPYVNVFGSDDGLVYGENYRDYMLMRLDGECWEGHDACEVSLNVNKNDEFSGWDAWKAFNKKGYDVTLTFERDDNKVTIITENNGILLKNTATINDGTQMLYAALTGDQCAITNIRIFQADFAPVFDK